MIDPDHPQVGEGRESPLRWPWAPWALCGLFLVLGLSVWDPFPPGIWHDDGVYVLLGRSLAEGHGLRYEGVPGAPLAPKFPPLFPLVLAVVWRLAPQFPENVTALGAVNLLFTALAAGVFSVYAVRVLRIPATVALGLTALIWISPHLWRVASIPLSEPLFMLLLLLALWAGGRMERQDGVGGVMLFLLAGALAFYARTLGLAVLAGGVLTLFLRGRRRAALGATAGILAVILPWVLWTHQAEETIPEPLMDTLGPYGGWLTAQIAQQPWEFLAFVWRSAGNLLARALSLLLPGLSGPWLWVGAILLPVLLVGLRELYRRSRLLTLTLLLSLGILLIWPFQEIRLLVPYQPILMAGAAVGFWRVWHRLGPSSPGGRSVLALGCVWALFFVSVSALRLGRGWVGEAYEIRSAALLDAVRAVDEKTPPDAVVGAPELWSGLALFTGRAAVPSARFRPLSRGGPVEGTPQEQYEIWIATGVTHLLVEHGGRVHGAALDRVDALCPPGTVQVLDSQPGRFLVALAWDGACRERVLASEPERPSG